MNFQPLLDQRQIIAQDLSAQIDRFFAAGKTAQQIDSGISGASCGIGMADRQAKLRAERDKLVPTLKYLADQGYTAKAAAEAMDCCQKRIKLMARENGITLGPAR